jgi:hypothetical protein
MSFWRRSVAVVVGSLGFLCCLGGPARAAGPVMPTVQCVFHNADGTYTGVFGYTSSSLVPIVLPVGGSNNFAPKPSDRGQPTVFQSGSHPSILVVTFTGTNLAWNLETRCSPWTPGASPRSSRSCW